MMPMLIAMGGKTRTRIPERRASMKRCSPCAAYVTHRAQPWAAAMDGSVHQTIATMKKTNLSLAWRFIVAELTELFKTARVARHN